MIITYMFIFEAGVGASLVSKFIWMWPEWTRAGMTEDFGDHFTATLYQGYFTYKDNKNRLQQDFCMCIVSVSLFSLFYPCNCIPIPVNSSVSCIIQTPTEQEPFAYFTKFNFLNARIWKDSQCNMLLVLT